MYINFRAIRGLRSFQNVCTSLLQAIFSLPGQSPGRAIVLPPRNGVGVGIGVGLGVGCGVGVSKILKFLR